MKRGEKKVHLKPKFNDVCFETCKYKPVLLINYFNAMI